MRDNSESKAISEKSWNEELHELTLQFILRLSGRVNELETEVEAGHLEQVAQLAHRLSGAAGSYGISHLAKESKNLECVALLKDLPSTRKSFETIKEIVVTLKPTEQASETLH